MVDLELSTQNDAKTGNLPEFQSQTGHFYPETGSTLLKQRAQRHPEIHSLILEALADIRGHVAVRGRKPGP